MQSYNRLNFNFHPAGAGAVGSRGDRGEASDHLHGHLQSNTGAFQSNTGAFQSITGASTFVPTGAGAAGARGDGGERTDAELRVQPAAGAALFYYTTTLLHKL